MMAALLRHAMIAPMSVCNDIPAITPATAECRFGQSLAPQVATRPGLSGVLPLQDGRDAFAARVLLADAAERTLDVQYYIWHNDLSGTLLLEALRRAADRGVRVRLLLDDINTFGLDGMLVALDSHPNIEVRLFNAFRNRRWRWFGFLTDFSRLNRRMHNKSFTVDQRVTIIGGRNIGDEYFGASDEMLFIDLDVLAVGAVVADVARDFERYWASASAAALSSLLPPGAPGGLDVCAAKAADVGQRDGARAYMQAIKELPIVNDLLMRRLPYTWAPTRMISDDPAKGLAREKQRDLVMRRLQEVLGTLRRELYLISPYFVPTKRGTAFFAQHAQAGLRVKILTNSLEATDVVAVHAGYMKRRKALLRAGVQLFELRRTAPGRKRLLRMRGSSGTGSSGSSLHSKTFSLDRERLFIGSFNFDQRSARLNTEMGFIIESPELAAESAENFDAQVPDSAYEVRLQNGRLQWIERNEGAETIHYREPGTALWQRALVRLISWLPIEWLL
jgi:putative cardiolipin synthase